MEPFLDPATLTATKSSLLNPVTLCNFPSLAHLLSFSSDLGTCLMWLDVLMLSTDLLGDRKKLSSEAT